MRTRAGFAPIAPMVMILFSLRPCDARTLTVRPGDAKALTSILAQARKGDTVRLLQGEYRLSGALAPPSGTHLIGEGPDKTILRFSGTQPTALVDLSGRSDVRISALTLDAGRHPQVRQGIFARKALRLRIDHVSIRNLGSNGLGIHFTGDAPQGINGVTDSVIEACRLENLGVGSEWGGGIRLSWGSARNQVLRNTIRSTGRGGIFADNGSTDLVIRGNTVSGSGGEGLGLEVWGGCHRSIIEDNRLDHWLSISEGSRCAARRNVIGDRPQGAKFIGIEMIGSDSILTDNVVNGGQQIGLSVSNKAENRRVFWGYNRVERSIQWGAQLQGEGDNLSDHYFYRCQFRSTGTAPGKPIYPSDAGHGFRINQNTRRIVLDSCDISSNRGLGVQVHGSEKSPSDELAFLRCRITNNGGAAAVIWPGYRLLSWKDCVVTGNADNTLPPARGEWKQVNPVTIDAPEVIRAGRPIPFAIRTKRQGEKQPSVLWDFGEGIPETSVTPTHVFRKAGRYRVTLILWNGQGRATHHEKWVRVK